MVGIVLHDRSVKISIAERKTLNLALSCGGTHVRPGRGVSQYAETGWQYVQGQTKSMTPETVLKAMIAYKAQMIDFCTVILKSVRQMLTLAGIAVRT